MLGSQTPDKCLFHKEVSVNMGEGWGTGSDGNKAKKSTEDFYMAVTDAIAHSRAKGSGMLVVQATWQRPGFLSE